MKFDINAFVLIEEVLGGSLSDIVGNPARLMKVTTIRALYWAGQLHDNPKMSMAEAGKLMQAELETGKTLEKIVEDIVKAIDASGVFPKTQASEDPQTSPANS